MPQISERNESKIYPPEKKFYYSSDSDEEEIIYPEQREDDMGESSIHAKLINRFLQMLLHFFGRCEDVFLSGNINLYYEEKNPNKWYAPDLLVAFGVPNHERASYQAWKENVFPQVIIEVASNRTWKTDISEKLETYGELGAEEYYILDPEFAYLPAPMMAFHRHGERLLSAPVNEDRIFSPRLGLEIVRTENNFRLFNPKTEGFLLTLEESEQKRHKIESELERLKAEIERLKTQK
ncbi:MAG: Uma2 family endonuclease [Acidobacteriota bacterium]|nr:Uma2 family endonuclease [Acidobacteriota bacterium]